MEEQYVVVQTLKTWMDQLLSTDPSDKVTVAGIAAEIQAAAGVLHRICSAKTPQATKAPVKTAKRVAKKAAAKKKVVSDDEEEDETDSGDVDDDLEDSASESEDDEAGDGSDDAGSDDSDETPKKKKTPKAAKRVAKKVKIVPMKNKKDPNAPKRPMSAYLIYCQEKRDQFRQSMPAATIVEISRALGESWKNMSPEDKKPFEEKAAQSVAQYKTAMEEYTSAQASKLPMFDVKEKKTPKKKVSDDSGSGTDDSSSRDSEEEEVVKKPVKKTKIPVKRPLSPYMFFMSEQRDVAKRENPGMSFVEIAKLLAQKWTQLSDAEKAQYLGRAAEDKKRYEAELAAFEQK